jgi:hypothetical protein
MNEDLVPLENELPYINEDPKIPTVDITGRQ